jgi:hypothetical protein
MNKYVRGLLIFALGFIVGIVATFMWLDRYAPSSYDECAESSWSAINTSDPPQCIDITGRVWIGPTYTPSETTTTLNE